MFNPLTRFIVPSLIAACGLTATQALEVELKPIGQYETNIFDESAAEIPSYDPVSKRLFVVNAETGVDILDLSDPTKPNKVGSIDVSAFGTGANSAVTFQQNGKTYVAVAVEKTGKDVDVYLSGYGSGMAKIPGVDPMKEVYLLTDRGPNMKDTEYTAAGKKLGVKIFPDPAFTPRIGRFAVKGEKLELIDTILLKDPEGNPITGLPNPGGSHTGETARDILEQDLVEDIHGIDSEGLVAHEDGTFWISDEYGPHIDHYAADGTRLERINPFFTMKGQRSLPPVYAHRRANRGMEGLALSADGKWLVGLMQSPMYNPSNKSTVGGEKFSVKSDSAICRILFFPVSGNGTPKEFLYVADKPNLALSEIRMISEHKFLVLERDGAFAKNEKKPSKVKRFYTINLTGATDVYSGLKNGLMVQHNGEELTLEQLATEENLAKHNIKPVTKTLFLDLLTTDYPHDKPEGMVLIDDKTIAIINDDDFGLAGKKVAKKDTGRIVQKTLPGTEDVDQPMMWVVEADDKGNGTVKQISAYSPEILVPADKKKQLPGRIVIYDQEGTYVNDVRVGFLPDMVALSPDGNHLVVANEGEPNETYSYDPEGSVSIIDLSVGVEKLTPDQVKHAGFAAFQSTKETLAAAGAHFPSPEGTTLAQDIEPEYVAIDPHKSIAYVIAQENNLLAVVDMEGAEVLQLIPLGVKDHMAEGNQIDASNKDGGIKFHSWPIHGLYQPDAIAAYSVGGKTYLVSANEGDARDYDGYSEETRVAKLKLDAEKYPNAAELQDKKALGRLKTTTAKGDIDGDGDIDQIYSYGARSFSIWDAATGELVFDSADQLERITAKMLPGAFNSTNDENGSMDNRSDDKGPEPEGLTIAEVDGKQLLFLGLERIGGVMAWDITNPQKPSFLTYHNNRFWSEDAKTAGDLGPEGLQFIPAAKSPNGKNLLVVANEVSGTTTVFEVISK